MSNVVWVHSSEGIKELLRSDEMLKACEEQAEAIKDRYGSEAEVDSRIGKGRANATIMAPRSSALDNNSLLKAVRE